MGGLGDRAEGQTVQDGVTTFNDQALGLIFVTRFGSAGLLHRFYPRDK